MIIERNLQPAVHLHKVLLISLIGMLCLVLSACEGQSISGDEAQAAWAASAHSDQTSPSFTNWNEDEPPEIPVNCAKCHSTPGYHDYIGLEGSSPNQVDQPAPVGTTIECEACHNEVAEAKQSVIMPSGLEISGLGQESNCMECHQGRAASTHLAETIADQAKDTVDTDLKMPNLHSNPAAAIFYGTEAKGGGEYPQSSYAAKFYHNEDTCATCHDPHSLQVQVEKCSACHLGATTLEGVRNVRLTRTDYDGDGNISEGLTGEIETMTDILLVTIELRTAATPEAEPITYNGRFLTEDGETYTTWTPRLLQAAYNYQYAAMDPGNYSHNPQYILQLLYDSIEDLGGSTRGMIRPTTDE
jgi:hypothetical protein